MDIVDVTETYSDRLASQLQVLQQAKSRRGEKPQNLPCREQALAEFIFRIKFKSTSGLKGSCVMHTSYIPLAYPPCTKLAVDLKPIMIRQLRLETHHRGSCIFLRSISPPDRLTAVTTVVEDEKGDVTLLHLYHQDHKESQTSPLAVKVGAIFLVKEPYFKITADKKYGLRVDHVSDVLHLGSDDPRVPQAWQPRLKEIGLTANDLKIKGNRAVQNGRFWDAIEEYSHALKLPATTSELEIIKRNRALVFLKTKQYDAALIDTGFPNFTHGTTEKGLFRAAEALYVLERFDECHNVLSSLSSKFPCNAQAQALLDCTRCRLREQRTGEYDFVKLQKLASELQPPCLDFATYHGPIEIKYTKTKGRGLFVTKNLKAGDIILCEKAFAYAHASTNAEGGSNSTLLFDPEMKKGFLGTQAELVEQIIKKLERTPSVASRFTTLYHGNYQEVDVCEVDGVPVVDSFLVKQIVMFNVFGCAPSSLSLYDKNCRSMVKKTAHHSTGIWTQASHINHNCDSTAHRAFIGDMMIVRATRDLEPGAEVTFWYYDPLSVYMKNNSMPGNHWKFTCDCGICLDARSTKPALFKKRETLLEDMKATFYPPMPPHHIRKHERLLDALAKTYNKSAIEVPRVQLYDPQLALAMLYVDQNKMEKSLDFMDKGFSSLGFITIGLDATVTPFKISRWGLMLDTVLESLIRAFVAFVTLGLIRDAFQAREYAKTVYRVLFGEDDSFEATYPLH